MKVFISYSWKDASLAHSVCSLLIDNKDEVWIDYRDLSTQEGIMQQLEKAVRHCDYFVIITQSISRGSYWVSAELSLARSLRKRISLVSSEEDVAQLIGQSRDVHLQTWTRPFGLGLSEHCLSAMSRKVTHQSV